MQTHDTTAAPRPLAVVIDDDDGLREAMVEILEDEGFEVREARNGLEALNLLATTPAETGFDLPRHGDARAGRLDVLQGARTDFDPSGDSGRRDQRDPDERSADSSARRCNPAEAFRCRTAGVARDTNDRPDERSLILN